MTDSTLQALADLDLFRGISPSGIEEIVTAAGDLLALPPGSTFLREGRDADSLFLVLEGEVEVLKHDSQSGQEFVLLTSGPGANFGDVALFDPEGRRSASVRTRTSATVLRLAFDRLDARFPLTHSVGARLRQNVARNIARELRGTSEQGVSWLRARIEEAETRAETGHFLSMMLTGIVTYMFVMAMTIASPAPPVPVDWIGWPVLVLAAGGASYGIGRSPYTFAGFGLTLENGRAALVEGLLLTIPLLLLILLARASPIDPLDLGRRPEHPALDVCLFIARVPILEFVVRVGLQAGLARFLTARWSVPLSIFLAGILFSATHLHLSFGLAVLSLPLGLYWGWVFHRTRIVGVCASHLCVGLFGLLLGLDGLLRI